MKPVWVVNKAFTLTGTELREKEQIKAWSAVAQEFMEIEQFELYLLDEKEMLEAETDKETTSRLTLEQESKMEMIQKELGWVKPRLCYNGQGFSELESQ